MPSRTTADRRTATGPAAVALLAPAKVNLTLHVLGRRPDGYHLLDSLVVFADVGDHVTVRADARSSLQVTGPFSDSIPTGTDNLALRAARLTGAQVAIALRKELPPGAGIGGGSSDAAAVLRCVAALSGGPLLDPLPLGADVPVCLAAVPTRMRGIGERLAPVPALPHLPMVLVNPGVPVSTGAVFAELGGSYGAPMPEAIPAWSGVEEAAAWLSRRRNDLEPAAARLEPGIAAAKAALTAQRGCVLARMSGSGSTVFGLFASADDARGAASQLAEARPDWWVRATRTLSSAPRVQESRFTT